MSHPVCGRTYADDEVQEIQREWYYLMRKVDCLHDRLQGKSYELAASESKKLADMIQAFVKRVNGRLI